MEATTIAEPRPLMDTPRLAEFLGDVSIEHIANLRKREGLPWVKVGNCIRFRPEAIESWLKSREQVASK